MSSRLRSPVNGEGVLEESGLDSNSLSNSIALGTFLGYFSFASTCLLFLA